MGKVKVQPLPKEVDQLKAQVLDWRRAKAKPRFPMPSEPWDAAVQLAKRFGVCRIARAVGLDYGSLRKRVEKAPAPAAAAPAFLEMPLERARGLLERPAMAELIQHYRGAA